MTERVALRPMDRAEFAAWRAHSVAAFAEENADAGAVPREDALAQAERDFADLLPEGAATEGMHLLRVLDTEGAAVGILWLGRHPQRADTGFVFDIEIEEARRREGLGRATMLAAEAFCRAQGWTAIALSVHGPNAAARALYDSLGFGVVATRMRKELPA